MLAYLINLFWIISSILLLIALVLAVVALVLLAIYLDVKDKQKNQKPDPAYKLTFNGPSYGDMQRTTSRLLKQDHQKQRKYRRPYFAAR